MAQWSPNPIFLRFFLLLLLIPPVLVHFAATPSFSLDLNGLLPSHDFITSCMRGDPKFVRRFCASPPVLVSPLLRFLLYVGTSLFLPSIDKGKARV